MGTEKTPQTPLDRQAATCGRELSLAMKSGSPRLFHWARLTLLNYEGYFCY